MYNITSICYSIDVPDTTDEPIDIDEEDFHDEYFEQATPSKKPKVDSTLDTPPESTSKTKTPVRQTVDSVKRKLTETAQETGTKHSKPTTEDVDVGASTSHQVDTTKGNLPNEGGTLQGESGNRKVQKQKSWKPVSVIMFNNSKPKTRTHVFYLENHTVQHKRMASDLAELLHFYYKTSNVVAYKTEIEYLDYKSNLNIMKNVYIIYWHPSFNIGVVKLLEKIGERYNDIKYFTLFAPDCKEDDEYREEIAKSLTIQFKNGSIIKSIKDQFDAAKTWTANGSSSESSEPVAKRCKIDLD